MSYYRFNTINYFKINQNYIKIPTIRKNTLSFHKIIKILVIKLCIYRDHYSKLDKSFLVNVMKDIKRL